MITILALWIVYYKSSKLIIYLFFSMIVIIQILDYRWPFLQWYHEYHQESSHSYYKWTIGNMQKAYTSIWFSILRK